jgi:hypothetical protein
MLLKPDQETINPVDLIKLFDHPIIRDDCLCTKLSRCRVEISDH